ncbi:MAG TPA: twin-arginine translocase subunit TatC [Blastocatellia bacterium]|nr:twin-arginine translocase subunit TatC [Blastocatellia bacterium]
MTSYTDAYDEQPELEQGAMSFLEHLDELRTRLIRIALFVCIAFVVCWVFSDRIYDFLQVPVRAAMLEAQREANLNLPGTTINSLADYVGKEVQFTFPTDVSTGNSIIKAGTTINVQVENGEDGSPVLKTMRPWVINTQSVIEEGYTIPPKLYAPGNIELNPDNRLVVPTVQGAFNLYIKVSFYAAIFFAVPFMLIQVWGFVAPGLYPHEKRYAAPIIIMTTVCFLLGCAFAYYIAFPRAANFLLGVAAQGNLRPLVTADEYFDLIITIMLGLGLVFEIPTITFFTARLGLVSPKMLLKVWRFAVIIIFIVAAVLSPTTDVPNLLVFAAPMLLLYFLSVGIAWVFHRRRQTEKEYQEMERKDR